MAEQTGDYRRHYNDSGGLNMSATHTYLAAGAVAVALNGLVSWILPPADDFMTVHDVVYSNGTITAERTIIEGGVADWRVTIVSNTDKPPTCNTNAGPGLHEGWSDYAASERGVRSMPLDVWVGDDGCLARLRMHPGTYTQYVTWTPRDGRDPVTFIGELEIK